MLKTFAGDLKAIRQEKKISLKDISQQTRLNVTILENLENGDFTFQPQTYIRAFLREYINCLGLDVEESLFDYDLARSGKYKSKRTNSVNITQEIKKEEITEPRESNIRITEKLKEIVETPKKIIEEKKSEEVSKEKKEDKAVQKISDGGKKTVEKKSENKVTLKSSEEKSPSYISETRGKKFFSFFSSPIAKNISLILFIALMLLGIYSLINILFLEGDKDKPEVVRQNFDEVVKEQEKKILGKRTPEEIQDSIRKAEEFEKLATSPDSITLKITSLSPGIIILITDSVNFNKPEKIIYDKSEVGIFKAKKSFYISSNNTESFKATINNKPLEFGNKSINKIKITKEGIIK